jgi:hypothetical protein
MDMEEEYHLIADEDVEAGVGIAKVARTKYGQPDSCTTRHDRKYSHASPTVMRMHLAAANIINSNVMYISMSNPTDMARCH